MYNILYYLCMIANPLSDSGVAISIYKMFKSLDILSRDITVYFPGFHQYDKSECSENEISAKKNDIIASNKTSCADYHGDDPVFYTYCESVGHIYFNEADFAKFIIELEDKTSKFEYEGNAQFILIPCTEGKILYDKIQSYNLESLYDYRIKSGQKIEKFLVTTLRLLQKDSKRNSLELIEKVDDVYNKQLVYDEIGVSKNAITIHLDNRIIEYMKWREYDEVFFISYSTKDEYHAYALKTLLEKHNKHVWIAPDGIPDSSDYTCVIPAALRISSRVVVLLSHNSANSVWVRREIAIAISNKKKIDAILLNDFTIDDLKMYDHLGFLFEGIQVKYSIIDLFEDNDSLEKWLN